MAEDNGITGISLNGVRKLIEARSLPEDLLGALNLISDAVIVWTPIAVGRTGKILWPVLERGDELVEGAKVVIRQLTKSQPSDYVDQVRRFAAANALLTYTALFDALSMYKQELFAEMKLPEIEKARIAALAASQMPTVPSRFEASLRSEIIVEVPHPVVTNGPVTIDFGQRLYQDIVVDTLRHSEALLLPNEDYPRDPAVVALADRVAALAVSVHQSEFIGMAVDYQPFFVWRTLHDQADKASLLSKLSDGVRAAVQDNEQRFELLGAALHNLDLGLDCLSRAIAAQPQSSPDGPRYPESTAARAAEALCRLYTDDIERPVIDDRYEPPTGGPRLNYPGGAAAYVPQAYRQVRYTVGETHLERDDMWARLPAASDLGPAINRYLESPYSTESPLLILGHPGSGKSLFTRVYAARLQYPRYTVVRVELRDANPAASIQEQVETQIRKDTGYDVNWADMAGNLPISPPIVILDGYDQLLQATGKLFVDYLDQVRRFQHDALIQNRPVRVIVTSRTTLIDKAIIPSGATILRLEPFDEPRRAEWIKHWNACNAAYFRESGIKPFRFPVNDALNELAEQPLLLLMLAIFDSAGNPLSERPDLDQVLLYDELLRRFVERELSKGGHGAAFSGLPSIERRPLVDRELTRLGVAAIGMFNRQETKILRNQLDQDLAYFGAGRQVTSDLYGLSQSEILLSSFFFIHESSSRMYKYPSVESSGPAAFEFLHVTFGEFLAADFILMQVIENAATVRDLAGKPTLDHTRQQHLSSLTPYLFAFLLYTPLYTRPNVLTFLREWSVHRLPKDPHERAGLIAALDEIVVTQLRALLSGTRPLNLATRARAVVQGEQGTTESPYAALPDLAYMATSTLNLILLRTLVGGGSYTLDAHALGAGPRPWDRLTNLWRSWFEVDPWPGSVSNGTYIVGDLNGPPAVPDFGEVTRESVDVDAGTDSLRELDRDGPDLLLRVYVPSERLYAAETGRMLSLFREWLTGVRRKGVRQSGYHTSSGEMFELFADDSLSEAALPAEFDTFEQFLKQCQDSPATISGILTRAGVPEHEALSLVTKYGKEYRRLRIDMRHERERRMMLLRHTIEGMFADYGIDLRAMPDGQLDSLLERMLPAPSTPSSLPAIAAPPVLHLAPNSSVNISQHFINATESTVIHSVQGTLHLGPKVNEVLALLDRLGGDDTLALKTAVHEMEDPQAPLASRKASHKKLKDFLASLAGKAQDIGVQLLEKYLESKGL